MPTTLHVKNPRFHRFTRRLFLSLWYTAMGSELGLIGTLFLLLACLHIPMPTPKSCAKATSWAILTLCNPNRSAQESMTASVYRRHRQNALFSFEVRNVKKVAKHVWQPFTWKTCVSVCVCDGKFLNISYGVWSGGGRGRLEERIRSCHAVSHPGLLLHY